MFSKEVRAASGDERFRSQLVFQVAQLKLLLKATFSCSHQAFNAYIKVLVKLLNASMASHFTFLESQHVITDA